MRRGWLILSVVALAGWEPFRTPHPAVERGNRAYDEQRWDDAVAAYEEARGDEATATPTIDFDVGTALLRKAEAMPAGPARTAVEDRALAALARAGQADDPALRSRAHYNRGNALLARDEVDDAIAAYKDALRADRRFEDARLNLEQALRRRASSAPPPAGKGGQGRGGQRAPGDKRGQPGQEQQPDPRGQQPPAPGQDGPAGTPGGPAGAPDDPPDAPPDGTGGAPPDATGGADPRAGQGNTSPDTPAQPPGDRQPGAQRGPRPTPRSPSSPAERKLDDLERSSRDLRREQIRRRAQDSYRPPTGPDW